VNIRVSRSCLVTFGAPPLYSDDARPFIDSITARTR
jgi:hypothetical protein